MDPDYLLPKAFLCGAGISALCSFSRPDVNFPLFLFAWLIWKDKGERVKVIGLLLITLIIDLVWLIFWGPKWSSDRDVERGVHGFVLAMSSLLFIYKLLLTGAVFHYEKHNLFSR